MKRCAFVARRRKDHRADPRLVRLWARDRWSSCTTTIPQQRLHAPESQALERGSRVLVQLLARITPSEAQVTGVALMFGPAASAKCQKNRRLH